MELKKLKVGELKTIIKNYKSKKFLITGKKKAELIEMVNGLNLSDEELNQLKVRAKPYKKWVKVNPTKKEEPPKKEDVKTEVNPLFQDKKPSPIEMEKSKVIKKSGSTIRKKEAPPMVMEKSKVIKKKGTTIRKKGAPKEEEVKKSKVSNTERVSKEIKEEKARVFKLIDANKKKMTKQALDKYVTQLEEIYEEATPQITSSGQKLSNLKSALIKYLDSRERKNKKK